MADYFNRNIFEMENRTFIPLIDASEAAHAQGKQSTMLLAHHVPKGERMSPSLTCVRSLLHFERVEGIGVLSATDPISWKERTVCRRGDPNLGQQIFSVLTHALTVADHRYTRNKFKTILSH